MAHGDATRQRLLRAALELFTTRGYHATTTPQIAHKARVAEGTIYRHFAGKQHLLNELYRGAMRWAHEQVLAAEALAVPPREQLTQVARAFAACAARDPGVIRMAFLLRHGELLDDGSREAARQLRSAIERLVARGKAEGMVRVGSAELWTGVWLAVVTHALDKVCAREWAASHPAVDHVIAAAWAAITGSATPAIAGTAAVSARPLISAAAIAAARATSPPQA